MASIQTDLAWERSQFMKDVAYMRPDEVGADINQNGASGKTNQAWDETHTGDWYIESQRSCADAIGAGLCQSNNAAIERGLLIMRWGFEQQQADGSFVCPDPWHSTCFFVEAAAHGWLLLNASSYKVEYQQDLDRFAPMIVNAAQWLKGYYQAGLDPKCTTYTHRYYMSACALGLSALISGADSLAVKGREYLRTGLASQNPSGFNPEKGGYDSSYHAVGLYFAERYYDVLATGELRRALYDMLSRACAWLSVMVRPDGTINPIGNTRTETEEDRQSGQVKKISYSQIYRSFYRWGVISGDPHYETLAWLVYDGYKIYKQQ